jgi:phage protein D
MALTVGMTVRHTNPDLADWEGQIQTDRKRQWRKQEGDGAVFLRVAWYAGLTGNGKRPRPGWVESTALREAE